MVELLKFKVNFFTQPHPTNHRVFLDLKPRAPSPLHSTLTILHVQQQPLAPSLLLRAGKPLSQAVCNSFTLAAVFLCVYRLLISPPHSEDKDHFLHCLCLRSACRIQFKIKHGLNKYRLPWDTSRAVLMGCICFHCTSLNFHEAY